MNKRYFGINTWLLVFLLHAASWSEDRNEVETLFSGECIIALESALTQNYRGGKAAGCELNIHLSIENGSCIDAWASAPKFNAMAHEFEVTSLEITAETIRLSGYATIHKDRWVGGGKAEFDIVVNRASSSDGLIHMPENPMVHTATARERLSGSYQGRFQGREVWKDQDFVLWKQDDAQAYGAVWESRKLSGRAPATIRERPRLLVRKHEVTALREKFETPLGQAVRPYLESSSHPAAAGLLYQLTQDETYAKRCYELILEQRKLERVASEHETHQSTYVGPRLARIALGWDLCYEAFDREQNEQIAKFLDPIVSRCFYQPWFGSKPICAPGAWKAIRIYAGGAMAALSMFGERMAEPPMPGNSAQFGTLQARFSGVDQEAFKREQPLQKNLWVIFGSGRPPML